MIATGGDLRHPRQSSNLHGSRPLRRGSVTEISIEVSSPTPNGAVGLGRTGVIAADGGGDLRHAC